MHADMVVVDVFDESREMGKNTTAILPEAGYSVSGGGDAVCVGNVGAG